MTGEPDRRWETAAAADLLAGRRADLWRQLLEAGEEVRELQDRLQRGGQHVVEIPPFGVDDLGRANGWLAHGRALLEDLQAGGKL